MQQFISAEQIQDRIRSLADEIRRDHPGGVHLVCVLKGAFMFLADLARALEGDATLDFIAVSSYGTSTKSSGQVQLLKDLDAGLEGRDVVIVEDIVDTGLTLTYLQDILRARAPTDSSHRLPAQQTIPAQGRRDGRIHRLHDRRQVRGGVRPGLRREVPEPAVHRRHRGIGGVSIFSSACTWKRRKRPYFATPMN